MPSAPRSMPEVSNGAAPRVWGWTAVAMAGLIRPDASEAECDPVLARVAAADERVARHEDRLPAAELAEVALGAHLQAGGREGGRLQPGLDQQPVAVDAKARLVQRGLRVGAVVDDRADELQVRLGLDEAAHDPEGPEERAVAREQAGDDRVVRPRAGDDLARHGEARAAVVQDDPGARRDNARAEAHEQALDERDRHAVGVDHAEVDGA